MEVPPQASIRTPGGDLPTGLVAYALPEKKPVVSYAGARSVDRGEARRQSRRSAKHHGIEPCGQAPAPSTLDCSAAVSECYSQARRSAHVRIGICCTVTESCDPVAAIFRFLNRARSSSSAACRVRQSAVRYRDEEVFDEASVDCGCDCDHARRLWRRSRADAKGREQSERSSDDDPAPAGGQGPSPRNRAIDGCRDRAQLLLGRLQMQEARMATLGHQVQEARSRLSISSGIARTR